MKGPLPEQVAAFYVARNNAISSIAAACADGQKTCPLAEKIRRDCKFKDYEVQGRRPMHTGVSWADFRRLWRLSLEAMLDAIAESELARSNSDDV